MTKDIIDTIDSLYNFIARLIILLEDELTLLTLQRNENNIVATKNIAETLNKLVNLLAQLNKLSNLTPTSGEIDEKDKIIIDNFLKNYQTKMLLYSYPGKVFTIAWVIAWVKLRH